MINFGTEFRNVIGPKSDLFRLCEGWTVYGVGWPSVRRGCSQIRGCVRTEFSDCSMAEIIAVYDSLEGCLKLN